MKPYDYLPVLSVLFFLTAFIFYKVYTKRERKEAKYSKPKSYEREQESIFMDEFLNVK